MGFLKDEDEDDRVNTQKDLCRSLTSELSKHHLKKKKKKKKKKNRPEAKTEEKGKAKIALMDLPDQATVVQNSQESERKFWATR